MTGASQIFKFVVRASCPRQISREQDAPTTIFLNNWDAPQMTPLTGNH